MHSFFSCVAPLKCAKNMLQILYSVFWIVFQTFQNFLAFPWSFVLLVGLLPVVSAAPNDDYESLNGNLRLVLLTRCFKQLSDPNATVVYRGNTVLLTVRMYFVVFIN